MTKREFLQALDKALAQLSPEERTVHSDYYGEMIDDRMEDGMTEEAAVAAMGNPSEIARNILQELPLGKLVKSRVKPAKGWSVLFIVLAVLASPIWLPVVLVLLAILLTVYAMLWVFVITVACCVLALLAGSIMIILSPLFAIGTVTLPTALLTVGCGLMGLAATVLGIVCAIGIFKGIVKLTKLLVRGIKSLFIRKG